MGFWVLIPYSGTSAYWSQGERVPVPGPLPSSGLQEAGERPGSRSRGLSAAPPLWLGSAFSSSARLGLARRGLASFFALRLAWLGFFGLARLVLARDSEPRFLFFFSVSGLARLVSSSCLARLSLVFFSSASGLARFFGLAQLGLARRGLASKPSRAKPDEERTEPSQTKRKKNLPQAPTEASQTKKKPSQARRRKKLSARV